MDESDHSQPKARPLPRETVPLRRTERVRDAVSATQRPSIHVGKRLGNYVVVECIGIGGMAEVYKARHPVLGTHVAIKVPRPEYVRDARYLARFIEEAKSAARLDSPNIVKVQHVEEDVAAWDVPFLVLEYLVGHDLGEELRRRHRLPLDELVAIFVPVLRAIELAHACGVVHRDLKPQNIVLASVDAPEPSRAAGVTATMSCASRKPVVVDFGIAKMRDSARNVTGTAVFIGTRDYAAPELLRHGSSAASEASDQFALGASLYECATGRPPGPHPEPPSTIARALSSGFDALVMRALHDDPKQRFADVRAMREALAALAPPPVSRPTRLAAPLAAGDRLGMFEIVACLGRGGMAEVYEARHTVMDTGHVAIKVPLPEIAAEPVLAARFVAEARAAARLSNPNEPHPNIVRVDQVEDGGAHGTRPFMVLELLEGRDLRTLLVERGALPFAEVMAIFLPVLEAVERAHARGVIHRDLTPGNIFLADVREPSSPHRTATERACAYRPVVVDFGLAKILDAKSEATSEGEVFGTTGYVAPELRLGSRYADARSDLYALGVMLYECVTGRKPFGGRVHRLVFDDALSATPPAPSSLVQGLPAAFDAVVGCAMRPEPQQRQASVRALREQLAALRAASAQASSAGQLDAQAAPQPRRRLSGQATLAALFVAVLLAKFALQLPGIESPGPPPGAAPTPHVAHAEHPLAADCKTGKSEPRLIEACPHVVPETPTSLSLLGGAYLTKGRLSEAEHALQRAIRLDPEDVELKYKLALVWYQDRRFDEACKQFAHVLTRDPEHGLSRYMLRSDGCAGAAGAHRAPARRTPTRARDATSAPTYTQTAGATP